MSSPSFSEVLNQELNRNARHGGGFKCATCTWYETLDSDAQAGFDAVAQTGNPGYIMALYRAAAQFGFAGSKSAFKGHMKMARDPLTSHHHHGMC
jgi:hypothetical protein